MKYYYSIRYCNRWDGLVYQEGELKNPSIEQSLYDTVIAYNKPRTETGGKLLKMAESLVQRLGNDVEFEINIKIPVTDDKTGP